jgi:uncharacterized phage-associated protein
MFSFINLQIISTFTLLKNMAYSKSQIDRIGNLLVYITNKLGAIPKTKLLKLIYIIEEEAIKKGGSQFTDLNYLYLPMGPVSTFVNTQIDKKREALAKFINIEKQSNSTLISAKVVFNDDEFSNFDIQLIDSVLVTFGKMNTKELIDYTHRNGSPWKKLHDQYNGTPPSDKRTLNLLSLLENEDVDVKLREIAIENNAFLTYLRN